MGKVIINREKNYVESLINFNIFLDNKRVDSIKNGEIKEFVIDDGNHEIFLKSTFDKSNTIKFSIDKFTTIYIDCIIGFLNPKLKIREQTTTTKTKLDSYEILEKLNDLKQKNIISEEEYLLEKEKILNKQNNNQENNNNTENEFKAKTINDDPIKENTTQFTKENVENNKSENNKQNVVIPVIGIIIAIFSIFMWVEPNVGIFFSIIGFILGIIGVNKKIKKKLSKAIICITFFTLILNLISFNVENQKVEDTSYNKTEISNTENQEETKSKEENESKKVEEEKNTQEQLKIEEEKKKKEEEKQKQAELEAQKQERIRSGEKEFKNGKFTLKAGHNGSYDGFSYYINGELVNNTSKTYSYVQIEFNLYDSNGSQIGTAFANLNNFEGNSTWKFSAISFGSDDENIASYKAIDVTAF